MLNHSIVRGRFEILRNCGLVVSCWIGPCVAKTVLKRRVYLQLKKVYVCVCYMYRCNIALIVLEMDRILRPGGWVLVRDSNAMVNRVEGLAKSVRWKTRILETESGPFGKDKLLSCQKPLWHN